MRSQRALSLFAAATAVSLLLIGCPAEEDGGLEVVGEQEEAQRATERVDEAARAILIRRAVKLLDGIKRYPDELTLVGRDDHVQPQREDDQLKPLPTGTALLLNGAALEVPLEGLERLGFFRDSEGPALVLAYEGGFVVTLVDRTDSEVGIAFRQELLAHPVEILDGLVEAVAARLAKDEATAELSQQAVDALAALEGRVSSWPGRFDEELVTGSALRREILSESRAITEGDKTPYRLYRKARLLALKAQLLEAMGTDGRAKAEGILVGEALGLRVGRLRHEQQIEVTFDGPGGLRLDVLIENPEPSPQRMRWYEVLFERVWRVVLGSAEGAELVAALNPPAELSLLPAWEALAGWSRFQQTPTLDQARVLLDSWEQLGFLEGAEAGLREFLAGRLEVEQDEL